MEDLHIFGPGGRALVWLVSGIAALLLVLLANKLLVTETGILSEGVPRFTREYLLVSFLTLLATVCLCLSVMTWRRGYRPPADMGITLGTWEKIIVGVALAACIGFFLLFVFHPDLFSILSLEDGAVEWASALLLFAASIACVMTVFRLRRLPQVNPWLPNAATLLAIVFFVIGMEEISWLQRVIGLESGPMFDTNIQGEINLHNFATEPVEIAYFFVAFAFTVWLPYMRLFGIFPSGSPLYSFLIPRPCVLYIGALACAFNYDMWNIFIIQISVFASLFILGYFMVASRSGSVTWLSGAVLVTLAVCQWGFLMFTDNYAREWEITEYKEFMIPLAFLAYSVDLLRQARGAASGETPVTGGAVSSRG